MQQEISNLFALIEQEFPGSEPKLEFFPSGAATISFLVGKDPYVWEYFPSLKGYGISKVANAVYGWEGVDQDFSDFQSAKSTLLELLQRRK